MSVGIATRGILSSAPSSSSSGPVRTQNIVGVVRQLRITGVVRQVRITAVVRVGG